MKNILLLTFFLISFTKLQSQDCPEKLICNEQVTISLAERTHFSVDDFLANHQGYKDCFNEKLRLFSLFDDQGELVLTPRGSLTAHCAINAGNYTVKVGEYLASGEYTPETILQECTTDLSITGTPVKCSFPEEAYDINLILDCTNENIVIVNGAQIEADPGTTTCIPFTTKNFVDMAAIGGDIAWNPSVLKFLNLTSSTLPRDLAYNQLESGLLRFSWFPFSTDIIFNGFDLEDNAVLFDLCFEVVGLPGEATTISFLSPSSLPTEFIVAGEEAMLADYCIVPGTVSISGEDVSSDFNVILNDNQFDIDKYNLGLLNRDQLVDGENTLKFETIEFDSYLEGISTLDIVLGLKILLLEEPIDPIKAIALDVDYSGGINVQDLVLMRQLILGLRQDLPHPGYFFLENDHVIDGAFDEFDFGYFDTYTFSEEELVDGQLNFKAFNYGDLSLTQFRDEQTEIRSSYESLVIENSYVRAGEVQRVRFSIDGNSDFDINAFQFGLDIEGGRVIDVNHKYNSTELMSNDLEGEQINFLYASLTPRDRVEFEVLVEFNTSGFIADKITLNKSYQTELVKEDLSLSSIKLASNKVEAKVLSIAPNPFNQSTIINIPDEYVGSKLMISNLLGKRVYESLVGESKIEIGSDVLGAQGVYLLTLSKGSKSLTKKLVYQE